MDYIIQFHEITKRFGHVVALDKVSLEVKKGEFLSLLGPSGCGKTTLLRTCAGLEQPTKGQVLLEGQDITHMPAYKRPVNMVFQRWALFPHKTVAENIAFGLTIKKTPRPDIIRQVRAMLELVKLEGYENRFPKQLSGGQSQRVALARALVMQPKVLLLDEPLGSLDLKLRQEMQIELINIHKRLGTTFIYVTHDQEEALTMSDRVVVMNHGHIVQIGPPAQIYQKPNSVFAAQFIGQTILFQGQVSAKNGESCQVATDELIITCPTGSDLHIGQDVFVSVRPERVRLNDTPLVDLENRLEGSIVNTIFKGPAVYYQIEAPGGRIITVQQHLEQDIPLYEAGSNVFVGWSSKNSQILLQ